MIKLNRTTEYGLMALRHMSRKADRAEVTSAREVADFYGIPFEITAKTLQRLKDTGLIQSAQGARGGYTLQRSLEDISLADFLELMEGPQSLVVCCGTEALPAPPVAASGSCEYSPKCEIKQMLGGLNVRVREFLSGIRLADVAMTGLPMRSQLGTTTTDFAETTR